MSRDEFLMAIARACKAEHGAEIALLVDYRSGAIERIGLQSATCGYDTPVVNILQNLGVSKVSGRWLFCTYEPSEMDLGMGCMRQVAGFIYLSGAGLMFRTVSDETGPSAPSAPRLDPWNATTWPARNPEIETAGTDYGKWLAALGRKQQFLTKAAFNSFDSYRSANKPSSLFTLRPVEDLKALQVFGTGLDSMRPVPMLYPELRDRFFSLASLALVGRSWAQEGARRGASPTRPGLGLEGGHNIGALMLDASNRIIGWGVNMMSVNGTFHAETAMVLAYLRRHKVERLPDGCRIYASLKPCHMCAGFIATVAPKATVVVAQDDPKIRNSALDAKRGGLGVTQTISAMTMPQGSYAPNHNTTIMDVLKDLLTRAGVGGKAVPFLYSRTASLFFKTIRGRPDLLRQALEKASPVLSQPATRGYVPRSLPGSGSLTSALDLAGASPGGPGVLQLNKQVPTGPLLQQVRGLEQRRGPMQPQLTGASREIEALDLAIGTVSAQDYLRLPNVDMNLKGLIEAMAQVHELMELLQKGGLLRAA